MSRTPQSGARFAPRRALGRTGFVATRLGIGDVADRAVAREDCVATLCRAIEAGLNVIDTAPGYEKGYSEEIVGEALRRTGRRREMFVINKIDFFDQPVAPQVETSLERMGMSEVDLFVLHGLSSLEAWHRAAAAGGLMEQLAACIRAGRCRFRGISSHHPDVLRVALASGLCDVVMFPVGAYVDARYVDEILPLARSADVGTVCFKTFGAGKLLAGEPERNRQLHLRPRGKVSSGGISPSTAEASASPAGADERRLSVRDCVRYTLTADPDVALLGMSFPNEQDEAFASAADLQPCSVAEMADLRRRAAEVMQGRGPVWWNPEGK